MLYSWLLETYCFTWYKINLSSRSLFLKHKEVLKEQLSNYDKSTLRMWVLTKKLLTSQTQEQQTHCWNPWGLCVLDSRKETCACVYHICIYSPSTHGQPSINPLTLLQGNFRTGSVCVGNRPLTLKSGTCPVVQWLQLCTSTAGDMGLIPSQGAKILYAAGQISPCTTNREKP